MIVLNIFILLPSSADTEKGSFVSTITPIPLDDLPLKTLMVVIFKGEWQVFFWVYPHDLIVR